VKNMLVRASIWVIAVAVAILLIYSIGAVVWPSKESELANKPEWSVLQVVESAHRSRKTAEVPPLKDYEGTHFDVVGIPARDGSNLWLLTNSRNIPQVKIMGGASFRISDAEYRLITLSLEVNGDVDVVLRNAIEQ
jgi:hypothetical protein